MKAILIDDEKHVREGIKLLVDWSDFGINEIYNAVDVPDAIYKIKREKPDIIFTDMRMPGNDGVEVLRWLQDEYRYPYKVIVISGYDDFNYTRKTIQYGGFDYIIKPIDRAQLNDTLKKAVYELESERTERERNVEINIQVNEVKTLYWDHALTHLLDHPGYIYQIRDRLKQELNFVDGDTECSVVLLQIDPALDKIKNKFKDRMDLLYYTLVNIANEYLRVNLQGVAFRYLTKEGVVLFLCKPHVNLMEFTARIRRAIQDTLQISFDLAVGLQALFSSELPLSYQSASYVHDTRNLLSTNLDGVYSSTDVGQAKVHHLLDHQNEFKVALLSGQKQEIEEWVTKFLDRCLKGGYLHRKQLQLWEKELELLREQMLNELGESLDGKKAEDDDAGGLSVWTENGDFSAEKLRSSLQNKFMQLADRIRQKQSFREIDSIYLIKRYIEENSATNINMQDISDLFFLSREYVSRRFKQEFGITLRSNN